MTVYIKDNKEAKAHDGTPHVSVLYRRKSAVATWYYLKLGKGYVPPCNGNKACIGASRSVLAHGGSGAAVRVASGG